MGEVINLAAFRERQRKERAAAEDAMKTIGGDDQFVQSMIATAAAAILASVATADGVD
jgi:hypothetical protein